METSSPEKKLSNGIKLWLRRAGWDILGRLTGGYWLGCYRGGTYLRELALAGCPTFVPFGLQMVAPVIWTFGLEEQKKKFLPRILNFDDWWCQNTQNLVLV